MLGHFAREHESRSDCLGPLRHRAGFADGPSRYMMDIGWVWYAVFWDGVRCGPSSPCLRFSWSVGVGLPRSVSVRQCNVTGVVIGVVTVTE
jgi:hypothetical protein